MLLMQTVMSKSKMKSLKDIKAQLLKDPKVSAEYEKQQPEFAIAHELIALSRIAIKKDIHASFHSHQTIACFRCKFL